MRFAQTAPAAEEQETDRGDKTVTTKSTSSHMKMVHDDRKLTSGLESSSSESMSHPVWQLQRINKL